MFRNLNIRWLVLLAVCFICLHPAVYPQTKECDIGFIDGTSQEKTKIVGQYEDLILVTDKETYKILNIRKVKTIRFDNGTYLWTGVGIGAVVGFVGGIALYEYMSNKKKPFLTKDAALGVGIIITIPCAIIGGLVGNLYRNIDYYDLSEMGLYMKAKEIKQISREQSMWR